MMLAKSKPILLMLCAMFVAGCGGSKYRTSRQGDRQHRKPVEQRDVPEMEMPKILPQTYYAAAQLFESQGQIEKAITQYRKAVAVNHHYVAAYNRLGILLGRTGEHEEAIRMFARAIQLKPEYPALHNNLGFEYAMRERWLEAERALRRALELKPDFDRARINLGLVLCRAGRFDEGLTCFMAVLPEPDAYYNLGLMLRGQERYEDAAEAFAHVLRLSPRFAAAREQLEIIRPYLEELRAERERQARERRYADAGDPDQDSIRRRGEGPATAATSAIKQKRGFAKRAGPFSAGAGILARQCRKVHRTAPRKLMVHLACRPAHWSTRLKQLNEELTAVRRDISSLEAKLLNAARARASSAMASGERSPYVLWRLRPGAIEPVSLLRATHTPRRVPAGAAALRISKPRE
jgi:tetratricopeptide (TPR) repeat protein